MMFRQGGVTIFKRMFEFGRFFAFLFKQLELKLLLVVSLLFGLVFGNTLSGTLNITNESALIWILFWVGIGLLVCYQQFIIAVVIGESSYNFWKVFFGINILSWIITWAGLIFFPILATTMLLTILWSSLAFAFAIGILYPGKATFLDAFLLQTILSIVLIVIVFILTGSALVLTKFIGSLVPVPVA